MKYNRKSFGVKLWLYFAAFAGVIFVTLWLLQIVFLQNFYDGMVEKNVKKAADQIAEQMLEFQEEEWAASGQAEAGEEWAAFSRAEALDRIAGENSLLLFFVDEQGDVLYGTDEHSNVYRWTEQSGGESWQESRNTEQNGEGIWKESQNAEQNGETEGQNPYHSSGEKLSWQVGAEQYLSLPGEYRILLEKLKESEEGEIGYRIQDGTAYVYGRRLETAGGTVILYLSASLEAVGATVTILRSQLIWITVMALLLAFAMAFFLSRRFARPVSLLSEQARRMAEGNYAVSFEKGFCSELDALADTLGGTAERLGQTETFRREFLANVSHDLRTPLTMIRGYAEMVRDFSWEDDAQREQDLSVIVREAERLSGLVNEILEYTSLQSGQEAAKSPETEFTDLDLGTVIREVTAQFEALCQAEGYLLETDIRPGLLVRGSRQQLSRVLYNLIDNGLSHSGENRKVCITASERKSVVRVEVRDFGEGIPRNDLPYIWERYFTLKQRKRNAKGSGLGLAISREILLAHGAGFGVESEEGEGSVFWFELEKRSPEETGMKQENQPHAGETGADR